MVAVLSVRNKRTHLQRYLGKPLFLNICITHSGLILSKNPEISKSSRALAYLVSHVAWIWWTRVAAALIIEC